MVGFNINLRSIYFIFVLNVLYYFFYEGVLLCAQHCFSNKLMGEPLEKRMKNLGSKKPMQD